MSKLRVNNKFGVIPNQLLNDPSISWKAKGIFGYLQSKPEWWDFAVSRICRDSDDWEKSTTAGIRELEKAWYLTRQKYQNEKWYREIEYILYDTPTSQNRQQENPTSENPTSENPIADFRQTNKKRITNIDNIKQEGTSKEVQSDQDEDQERDNYPIQPTESQEEAPPKPAAPPPMRWRPDIQELIYEIRKKCDQLWVAYEDDKDTYFAKHILDAKEFGNFAAKLNKTRVQLAVAILAASAQINYRKWVTAWPRRIYKEYQEVYNTRVVKHKKEAEKKPLNSVWKLC